DACLPDLLEALHRLLAELFGMGKPDDRIPVGLQPKLADRFHHQPGLAGACRQGSDGSAGAAAQAPEQLPINLALEAHQAWNIRGAIQTFEIRLPVGRLEARQLVRPAAAFRASERALAPGSPGGRVGYPAGSRDGGPNRFFG